MLENVVVTVYLVGEECGVWNEGLMIFCVGNSAVLSPFYINLSIRTKFSIIIYTYILVCYIDSDTYCNNIRKTTYLVVITTREPVSGIPRIVYRWNPCDDSFPLIYRFCIASFRLPS